MHEAYKRTAVSSINKTNILLNTSQNQLQNASYHKTLRKTTTQWKYEYVACIYNAFHVMKQVDYVKWVNTGTTQTMWQALYGNQVSHGYDKVSDRVKIMPNVSNRWQHMLEC